MPDTQQDAVQPPTPPVPGAPPAPPRDWLDEIVTDEAKRDPDWRAKALTGNAAIGDD